jgi:U3 small nucleolar RNA-associated protein 12
MVLFIFFQRLTNLLAMGLGVELCTRCAVFIVRLHHAPLTASGRLSQLLQKLQYLSRSTVNATRDLTGTNLAAMRLLKRSLEANQAVVEVFDMPAPNRKKKGKA